MQVATLTILKQYTWPHFETIQVATLYCQLYCHLYTYVATCIALVLPLVYICCHFYCHLYTYVATCMQQCRCVASLTMIYWWYIHVHCKHLTQIWQCHCVHPPLAALLHFCTTNLYYFVQVQQTPLLHVCWNNVCPSFIVSTHVQQTPILQSRLSLTTLLVNSHLQYIHIYAKYRIYRRFTLSMRDSCERYRCDFQRFNVAYIVTRRIDARRVVI